MIACGIDLVGNNAILVVLEKREEVIKDITGKFTKLQIENDENCKEVRSFMETIRTHFDSVSPDRIGIIKRHKRGQFSGGAVSFKIEGLIQLYEKKNVYLVSSQTLRSFKKKNSTNICPKNKYQEKACLLAVYLLEGI